MVQCSYCDTVGCTIDHIIPQKFLESLGFTPNEPENLQYLCESCNKEKGHLLDYRNPKTLPLLGMYIDRWKRKHRSMYERNNRRKLVAICHCADNL